jgi:hypothetical protein
VESVLAKDVIVRASGSAQVRTIRALRGKRTFFAFSRYSIPYASDEELGAILEALRDAELPLADAPDGWPPAAVFQDLRDRGITHGSFVAITWSGPDFPRLSTK